MEMKDLTREQISKIDKFILEQPNELATQNLFSQAIYGIVLNYNTPKIKSYGFSETLQTEIIVMRESLGLE